MSRELTVESDVVRNRSGNDRRAAAERRRVEAATAFTGGERRKTDRRRVERRRQIDPTTCERDYTVEQVDFMKAMDLYKRRSGRQFPTWSEVLEVVESLGYRKVAEPTEMYKQPEQPRA